MLRLTAPAWVVTAVLVAGVGGLSFQFVSLPATRRRKITMLTGIICGAGIMALVSLAKEYDFTEAALLFGDVTMAFAIGWIPMRAEAVRAVVAEAKGVKIKLNTRPLYIGIVITFGIFVGLLMAESLIFG